MYKALLSVHQFFWEKRFLHFLFTGAGGALLNLFTTWIFTRFVFGLNQYFYAYLLGVSVNFIFNFVVHTVVTFRTTKNHLRRLLFFTAYSVCYVVLLSLLVGYITPIVGVRYYLLVIASIIGLLSLVNFFVFKHSLFRE